MIWVAAYVLSIILANVLITAFGFWPVGFGLMAPAGVYAAGLSFGLRDAVQDRLGKPWTIGAILIGAGISAVLSWQLAIASGLAFLLSEYLDMAVYTPLRHRTWLGAVVASNVVGSIVDSVVFLWLAGIPLEFVAGQVVGKWWATLAFVAGMWLMRRRRGLLPGHASPELAG